MGNNVKMSLTHLYSSTARESMVSLKKKKKLSPGVSTRLEGRKLECGKYEKFRMNAYNAILGATVQCC